MKILSIGNSFSQDAHRYIYELAKQDGTRLKTANLYIGGCSLRKHYLNILDNNQAYLLEYNGQNTDVKVSINQLLASDDWDVITLQQVSSGSVSFETYTPYIEFINEHVKRYCPKAKVYLHQTWAYEDGSEKLKSVEYDSAKAMIEDAKQAYLLALKAIGADGIIPSGQAMYNALQMGIGKIHRDTTHASFGAGRYLLALTWYKALTGKDISNNCFNDFDEPVSEEERKIVINAVNSAF